MRVLFGCVVLSLSATALSQVNTAIIRDGTVGNPDLLLQPVNDGSGVFDIDESMGNRPGEGINLFHSFDQFSIGEGDTALFSADSGMTTENIISRVTGGMSPVFLARSHQVSLMPMCSC